MTEIYESNLKVVRYWYGNWSVDVWPVRFLFRRPLPAAAVRPTSQAAITAMTTTEKRTWMAENRGAYREPRIDVRRRLQNGDVMRNETFATAFVRTLEMAAEPMTVQALVPKADLIDEQTYEKTCMKEHGPAAAEGGAVAAAEHCHEEFKALTKTAPKPPMSEAAPVTQADLMESSTPKRGAVESDLTACPADVEGAEYQVRCFAIQLESTFTFLRISFLL